MRSSSKTTRESAKKRILAADDEIKIRVLYEELCNGMGHEIVTVSNGREACERFQELRPDLVILDIKMPEMHGLEALKRIRRLDHAVPIIISSAYSRLTRDKAVLMMSVFSFINKPFDIDTFRRVVNDALNHRESAFAKKEKEMMALGPKASGWKDNPP